MSSALVIEQSTGKCDQNKPHLSFSQLNRYLLCPEQYRFYYLERLRPRLVSASLVFGKSIHEALAYLLLAKGDAADFFAQQWQEAKDANLRYAYRDSWEKMQERGQLLLKLFAEREVAMLSQIVASEKPFELSISNLNMPLVGIIDLLVDINGRLTVVDFKTSSSAYEDHEVVLSDQLTAYQLAEPDAIQSAFCVLIKTKEPKIEWHFSQRSGEQLVAFLEKLEIVARSIANDVFYRRSGQWCSWCDYLPICMGDKERMQECLLQAA